MTFNEAKDVFLNRGYVEVEGGQIFNGDKWRQCIVVISEWLKQQPCEDAISRQAVLDLPRIKIHNEWGNVIKESVDVNDVKALPSAVPQQEYRDIAMAFQLGLLFGKADKAIEEVKKPVAPQSKTGHWCSTTIQGEMKVQGQIDGQIIEAFVCSECGAISVFRMADGEIVNGDLCPNCGAKMEAVKNENCREK